MKKPNNELKRIKSHVEESLNDVHSIKKIQEYFYGVNVLRKAKLLRNKLNLKIVTKEKKTRAKNNVILEKKKQIDDFIFLKDPKYADHNESEENKKIEILKNKKKIDCYVVKILKVQTIFCSNGIYEAKEINCLELRYEKNSFNIFFTNKNIVIDNLNLELNIKTANYYFLDNFILFEFKKNFNFVLVKFNETAKKIHDFFLNTCYLDKVHFKSITFEKLKKIQMQIKQNLKNDNSSPKFNIDLNKIENTDFDESRKKSSVDSDVDFKNNKHVLDHENFYNDQKSFYKNPLKYRFIDNDVLTITISDFKTLFNNNWINDSIIDFFIKYEIESAIKNNAFKNNQIYAFNSFFFSKLMTKNVNNAIPDFYENVKRWLNKIDLLSFLYIIIPINENSHWYFCIIKGLSNLKLKSENNCTIIKNYDLNELKLFFSDNNHENKIIKGKHFQLSSKLENSQFESTDQKNITIFVFDSLSHTHNNVEWPFKKFLVDYFKIKHNLTLDPKRIVFQNAKVPKQKNFNDCGIHVIYNIKKWLNNIENFEKIWNQKLPFNYYKNLFVDQEKIKMRKNLINILLKLHKQQNFNSKSISIDDLNHNEDDLIVIENINEVNESSNSFLCNKKIFKIDDKNSSNISECNSNNNQNELLKKKSDHVVSTQNLESGCLIDENKLFENLHLNISSFLNKNEKLKINSSLTSELINKNLNEKFSNHNLSKISIIALNTIFSQKKTTFNLSQLNYISHFIFKINFLDYNKNKDELLWHIQNLNNNLNLFKETKNFIRPKDKILKIEDRFDDANFLDNYFKFIN